MKKMVAVFIAGFLLVISVSVNADSINTKIQAVLNKQISVEVNGEKVLLENTPITYNNTTYIPLREASNLLDTEVEWDGKTNIIRLKTKDETIDSDTPEKGENNVNENTVKVVDVDGIKYISLYEIEHNLIMNNPKLGFRFDSETKKYSLIQFHEITRDDNKFDIIIESIPLIVSNGSSYTEKSFYENVIIPTVKKLEEASK